MKTARLTLSVACIALLGLGFLLSSRAALNGPAEAEAYARKMDQPPIVLGALLLLITAIVIGCIKDRDAV